MLAAFQLIREKCGADLEGLSPKRWCRQIPHMVFVLHGANDTMIPFTESVLLSENLPLNVTLISHLFGHKTIELQKRWRFFMKEAIGIVRFLSQFLSYNEHSHV